MDTKLEHGLKVFGELMGTERVAAMRSSAESRTFGADITKMALNYAFADTWGREGLERKQRSLLTIGVLIASKQILELKNHVRIGVRNGLTAREFEEALIHCIPYVGFPAIASATTAVLETLRELGIATDAKTSEERGLL